MNRAVGFDVSKWEGLVNYKQSVANGASFVFVKASEYVADPMFATNWKNAKAAGLLRGAFHFLDWNWSEIGQAELFLKTVGTDIGELPLVLDLEVLPLVGMTAAVVAGKAWNFLTYVEKMTGHVPMLYVGYYYWNDWGSNNLGWTHFPLWLPWYAWEIFVKTPKPWTHWNFWQPSAKWNGPAFGCQSLSVDGNYFNGSVDDLKKFTSGMPLPAPTPTPAPVPQANTYRINAGVNPNVHSGSGGGPVIGYLLSGTLVVVDDLTSEQWYAHFLPVAGYPAGGWTYKPYLTKV